MSGECGQFTWCHTHGCAHPPAWVQELSTRAERAEAALAECRRAIEAAEESFAPNHDADGVTRAPTDELREMFRWLKSKASPSEPGAKEGWLDPAVDEFLRAGEKVGEECKRVRSEGSP